MSVSVLCRDHNRVWLRVGTQWHKATVTNASGVTHVRTDAGMTVPAHLISSFDVCTMLMEDEVLSGLLRVRALPSVAHLRVRCNDNGIAYTDRMRKHELIQLLLPEHNDKSLAATMQRDFLGVQLPFAPTPFALPVHAPPGVFQDRRIVRDVPGDTRAASVSVAIEEAAVSLVV